MYLGYYILYIFYVLIGMNSFIDIIFDLKIIKLIMYNVVLFIVIVYWDVK